MKRLINWFAHDVVFEIEKSLHEKDYTLYATSLDIEEAFNNVTTDARSSWSTDLDYGMETSCIDELKIRGFKKHTPKTKVGIFVKKNLEWGAESLFTPLTKSITEKKKKKYLCDSKWRYILYILPIIKINYILINQFSLFP